MVFKYFLLGFLYFLFYQHERCSTESLTYISTEHAVIIWHDSKYFMNCNVSSRRIGRQDPRYYMELNTHTLFTLSNKIKLHFYFYEFLTNRYRPSFVEMHFKFCDMVQSDLFFGVAVRRAFQNRTCPFPPGEYHLKDMYISYVPKGFPFTKGRIYLNLSNFEDGEAKIIASGRIDMEVKVAKIKKGFKI